MSACHRLGKHDSMFFIAFMVNCHNTYCVHTHSHTPLGPSCLCCELDKNRPETNISIVPDGINSSRSEILALSVDSTGWLTAWKRFQNKHHIRLIIHELRGFKSNNKAGRKTELLGAWKKSQPLRNAEWGLWPKKAFYSSLSLQGNILFRGCVADVLPIQLFWWALRQEEWMMYTGSKAIRKTMHGCVESHILYNSICRGQTSAHFSCSIIID